MTEQTGGVAATAELTGGAGQEGAAGGATAPEWIGQLPDDLKGDATLGKYASIEALARGHLETKKLASSKLALPAADAPDEEWAKTFKALGVPDKPDGYGEFGLDPLPDDADDAAKEGRANMVKAYAERLHQLGVPPKLASGIVKADLERIAEAETAYYAKGAEEIAALQKEMGADYEPQKEAAKSLFLKIFGEEAAQLADQLDQKVGSGLLMRGMMKLAKLTGEHVRIDGAGGGFGGGTGNAQAQLDAKFQDQAWRQRFKDGDATAVAEHDKLLKAAQEQAIRGR